MGGEGNVCNLLQAPAASRATREPPVKRVSQVGGHSYHHMKQFSVECLEELRKQVMGCESSVCQLLAGANGITGVTGASGQTGVTGGWTLIPMHEALHSLVPWRCHEYK